MLTVLGGLVVVGVAAALETSTDCPGSGYGGYGCVDLDDAQLVVEPSTDLVDRQTVRVTGVDFDPHSSIIGVAQCDAALAEEFEIDGCDLSTAVVASTDENGGVQTDIRVRRIISTAAGGEVDCAVDDACVIGGGTLDDFFAMAVETATAPISFDPSVPPVPPLTVDIDVDEVTAGRASGSVICNREATLDLSVSVSQTKGRQSAESFGYLYLDTGCDVTPTEWTVALMPSSRRLTGGPATATAFGYAFDGFESAFTTQTFDVRLRGEPRNNPTPPPDVVGEFTSIQIIGTVDDTNPSIVVEVVCERAAQAGSVFVSLSQWAGLDRIDGYGSAPLDGCDGTEQVVVPVQSFDGVLVGGPAQVVASVFVQSFTAPDEYFFDNASTSGQVRLRGRSMPGYFTPEPDPDSRITIGAVTRTSLSGTVECEEPVTVFISGGGQQTRGRTTDFASGFAEFACDGTTPFIIDLAAFGGGLRGGEAAVSVFAEAYRDDFFDFAWFDEQQATVRVRGSG